MPVRGSIIDVRYREGGDNAALRLSLFEVYHTRCYICTQPQLFHHTEIDHIIPRTCDAGQLAELVTQMGLPAAFDLHAPANLALICSPCNGRKGPRNLLAVPLIAIALEDAGRKAPAVIRRVHSVAGANAVARSLTSVTTADLQDPNTRDALLEHAPSLVQILALLDESRVQYHVKRPLNVRVNGDAIPVTLILGEDGRAAQTVVEQVLGGTLNDPIYSGVAAVVSSAHDQIRDQVQDWAQSQDGALASLDRVDQEIAVRVLRPRRMGGHVRVMCAGMFQAEYQVTTTIDSRDGCGPQRKNATITIATGFSIRAVWNLNAVEGSPADTSARIVVGKVTVAV
jgi:hypothetical protein